ncbi:MAG: L,D-transpeptidase [Alphaproteobacteria bacterium]
MNRIWKLLLALTFMLPFVAISQQAAAQETIVRFPNYYGKNVIVIRTAERKLYYTLGHGKAIQYPIAVGRDGMQRYGTTRVSYKRVNPEWRPTPRMRREDPKLPEVVPGGPGNPLGVRAMYLGWDLYRIHGTNNPSSIGKAASSGCYRMYNSDVVKLYDRVKSGTKVVVEK